MRISAVLAALAATLTLAACETTPTEIDPTETVFSAEYRLAGETSWRPFLVTGQQPAGTPSTTSGEWVFTLIDPVGNWLWMVPQQQLSGGVWVDFSTLVPLTLERGESVDLYDPNTGPCQTGGLCTYLILGLNRTQVGGQPAEICRVTDGTMVITRTTDEWVSATFSGTGTCTRSGVTRTFEVRNGELDAAIPPIP
jgi:hypothetical protein